ncbi:MAG: hypothetical protein GXO78_10930 [Calditrichaeota bacterium]|nr:hypothetical protein [Calditrichota bacterium]
MNDARTAAAVLKYDQATDVAPRLVAKGYGEVAKRIIELAKSHQLPVVQDPHLVSLLMKLDVDESIPVTLFQAVAEIYAFIMNLERRHADR